MTQEDQHRKLERSSQPKERPWRRVYRRGALVVLGMLTVGFLAGGGQYRTMGWLMLAFFLLALAGHWSQRRL